MKVTVWLSRSLSTTTRSQVCQGGARSVTEQPLVEQFAITRPSFKAEAEPSLKTNGHAPLPVCDWQSVTETNREETNSGTNTLVM